MPALNPCAFIGDRDNYRLFLLRFAHLSPTVRDASIRYSESMKNRRRTFIKFFVQQWDPLFFQILKTCQFSKLNNFRNLIIL